MEDPLDPVAKKAYEISYALFRVAAILPSRPFAELLEKEALGLLSSAIDNDPAGIKRTIRSLSYLVSFGKDTGNIHIENGDLLLRQIDSLNEMVQIPTKKGAVPADIGDIFNSGFLPAPSKSAPAVPLGDRQRIIVEKIRQSGNCHARDLQAVMPGLSERTLRYDLQRLVEQGRIERGGGGGPASWYRVREGFGAPEPDLVPGA